MKATGPQIVSELRGQLQIEMGRHMYGVLGTYSQLSQFEVASLTQGRDPFGNQFPVPINLGYQLLSRIEDEGLRKLVNDEAKRPQAIQNRLNRELDNYLRECFRVSTFIILKHLELLFAYELDFSAFRMHATNLNHILLLLPGERRSDHLIIFHEAEPVFHRTIPVNLIADNHLWELADE